MRYTGATLVTYEEWWVYERKRRNERPYSAKTSIRWHGPHNLSHALARCPHCAKVTREGGSACEKATIHRVPY